MGLAPGYWNIKTEYNLKQIKGQLSIEREEMLLQDLSGEDNCVAFCLVCRVLCLWMGEPSNAATDQTSALRFLLPVP